MNAYRHLLYAIIGFTVIIVIGTAKRMEQKISKLQNHVIICGLGRVGRQVVKELQRGNMPIVVIDRHASSKEEYLNNILNIEGDATEDEVLYQAGIERASGIVAALPQDTENVYIALTAKGIRSDIHVVARAEKSESEDKLHRAGADRVINPSSIGGRRIAMSILKPISFDYMDTIEVLISQDMVIVFGTREQQSDFRKLVTG